MTESQSDAAPIPEGSEDFPRPARLRRDAESINNGVERSLDDKRASAKGWCGQLVDLLGQPRVVNAITLAAVARFHQVQDGHGQP